MSHGHEISTIWRRGSQPQKRKLLGSFLFGTLSSFFNTLEYVYSWQPQVHNSSQGSNVEEKAGPLTTSGVFEEGASYSHGRVLATRLHRRQGRGTVWKFLNFLTLIILTRHQFWMIFDAKIDISTVLFGMQYEFWYWHIFALKLYKNVQN